MDAEWWVNAGLGGMKEANAMGDCVFCDILSNNDKRIVRANTTAVALYDAYPLNPGHALVIPKRHIQSFCAATPSERADLLALLDEMKAEIDSSHAPQAYNIGVNDGPAAGQTVPHLHIHLIPRYEGDMKDPRGGVRWVLPDKAVYWDA